MLARRHIQKGEEIKYLCGTRAILTQEEEDNLEERGKDFSILTRLGIELPLCLVRFADHDFSANARLVTAGACGVKIFAVRSIGRRAEIGNVNETAAGQVERVGEMKKRRVSRSHDQGYQDVSLLLLLGTHKITDY